MIIRRILRPFRRPRPRDKSRVNGSLRSSPDVLNRSRQRRMGLILERVAAAQAGENSTVICRMPSGWAVMGDAQVLRGYCLLLPDPVVPSLNDLHGGARAQFLEDYVRLGDAVLKVTG